MTKMTDTIRYNPNMVNMGPVVVYGCWPPEEIGYPLPMQPAPSTVALVYSDDHDTRVRYEMMLEMVVEMCERRMDHEVIQRAVEATLKRG